MSRHNVVGYLFTVFLQDSEDYETKRKHSQVSWIGQSVHKVSLVKQDTFIKIMTIVKIYVIPDLCERLQQFTRKRGHVFIEIRDAPRNFPTQ